MATTYADPWADNANAAAEASTAAAHNIDDDDDDIEYRVQFSDNDSNDRDASDTEDPEKAWLTRRMGGPGPLLMEKIVRERVYETRYWLQHCHSLTTASLMDQLYDESAAAVGGCVACGGSVPTPTPFLCLLLRLLHLRPTLDIVLVYVQQAEFKYLRALGALYLRLAACQVLGGVLVYRYLEPLLEDSRKLRMHHPDGSVTLTHMDVFVDELLTGERVCDTALPRLTRRDLLEDSEQLEPRVSPLAHLLQSSDDDNNDNDEAGDDAGSDHLKSDSETAAHIDSKVEDAPPVSGKLRLKLKNKKVNKSTTAQRPSDNQSDNVDNSGGGAREELSIEETNKMRAALGLKPLK